MSSLVPPRRDKSGSSTKYAPMRSDSTSTVDSIVNASADETVFENNAMKRQLFKTKICRHHLIGRCKYSENCFFAHSVDQIARRIDFRRTKLCSKSNCRDANCLYAHSVDEIRDPYADVCESWVRTLKTAQTAGRPRPSVSPETLECNRCIAQRTQPRSKHAT